MKIGDLIKVNTERVAGRLVRGQLGVIVGFASPGDRQWKVRLMDGELFWFDDNELEVQE
jgi:hypothetical protein